MRNKTYQTPTPKTASSVATEQPLPTFLDHVHELRRRLFWVVAVILVASSAAYGFLNSIINILTLPLGNERLFYLTPAGGLSFSFKLCAYVGILAAVPVIMYQLYRFMEPLMGTWRRSALFYVGLSSVLAAAGVLFAYFVTLPAALHFLTGFNLSHVQAMLTVDSYLSFVVTYLLGAALLFQIPLLLLITNSMTPLKPSKLMKAQRFVIVGAFVIGAIISPTPDMLNQTIMALPIIAMYQLGVIMVWVQNRSRARRAARAKMQQPAVTPMVQPIARSAASPAPQGQLSIPVDVLNELIQPQPRPQAVRVQPKPQPQPRPVVRTFNDFAPRRLPPKPTGTPVPKVVRPARQAPPISVPVRSVDGFVTYRPIQAQPS